METTASYRLPNDCDKSVRRSKKRNKSMRSPLLLGRSLNATGLEPLPEDLLEEGDVIEVHQGVVLAGNVSEGGTVLAAFDVTAAESLPWFELVVDPVGLRSLEGNGIENVQDLWNSP